jgi:hypothetical protein
MIAQAYDAFGQNLRSQLSTMDPGTCCLLRTVCRVTIVAMRSQTTERHCSNAKGAPLQQPQSTTAHHNIAPRTRCRIAIRMGFAQGLDDFLFNERDIAGLPVAAALRCM